MLFFINNEWKINSANPACLSKPTGDLRVNAYWIQKQSLSTTSSMDRHLLHQKIRHIISVMKTNTGVFVVFKTKRELKCQNELFWSIILWKYQCLCFHYWDYLTSFWHNNWRSIIDVVERLCLSNVKLPLIKNAYQLYFYFLSKLSKEPPEVYYQKSIIVGSF